MENGVSFKIELKIDPMLMFMQVLEAFDHEGFWVTRRKRRPARILLKAITKMPKRVSTVSHPQQKSQSNPKIDVYKHFPNKN